MALNIAQGLPSLDVQKDDVTITPDTEILNFEGDVTVTDEGNGKATVTVGAALTVPFLCFTHTVSSNFTVPDDTCCIAQKPCIESGVCIDIVGSGTLALLNLCC